MKKLLALFLAVGMVFTTGALTAFARKDDDDEYDNLDFFEIKETNTSLYPGQDYYFATDWQGTPINDDFFEYYRVTISVKSDDDDVSSLKVRNRINKAEFVKNEATGEYFFHVRANTNFSDDDDMAVLIRVLAKDKDNTDKRSWYEMNLDVNYSDSYLPKEKKKEDEDERDLINSSQYDVNNYSPAIEFDEDLKQCRLDFDDGSYYTIRISNTRKFNFGYTDIANPFVVQANPSAKLHFRSFYARPQFANEDVFKLKAPADKKYLYEINEDNTLTLISQDNNNGYFGFTPRALGSYVASNVPLASPATSVGVSVSKVNESSATASSGSAASGSTAASATPAGSIGALQNLITRNFSNKFVLLSNGSEYGVLDKAVTLSASISLEGLDTSDLYLYTYDGANNRLIQSPNRPKVGSDGKLSFTTNTKGYYAVTSGKLTQK